MISPNKLHSQMALCIALSGACCAAVAAAALLLPGLNKTAALV